MVFQKSKRAKRKAYFISANPVKKKRTDVNLTPGMKGFICTCNGNVKGCIREALNILDDYNCKINLKNSLEESETNDADDLEDIEKVLEKEITSVKNPEKKFKPVDTGANNCLFISTEVDNILELSEAIMKDIEETKIAKSRFLIRLVPIEITCKAYNDDIKKAADSIFDAHFKGDPTSYCIHINKRSNNNLLRMEVTDDLARLVRDRNINHVVDLKNPAKTVIVEIIRNVCGLSVVNNFFALRKYNLIELANTKKPEELEENKKVLNTASDSKEITSNENTSVASDSNPPEPDADKANVNVLQENKVTDSCTTQETLM